jgi:hypothetical protein
MHRSAAVSARAAFSFAILLAASLSAPVLADRAATKSAREVSTFGPAVPLSAHQLAALAAKRALLPPPARIGPPPPGKAEPVTTIGGGVQGPSRKPWNAPAMTPGARVGPATASREFVDPLTLEAVVAALGPEASRAAGLVKSGDRVSTDTSSAPAARSRR